jgi:hypothetical protein
MKNLLLATAAGALLFAFPAHAQTDCQVDFFGQDFSQYDTNNDCALDEAEFSTVLETNPQLFDRYDMDNDGVIGEDEFDAATTGFGEFDANQDRMLDAAEMGMFWGDEPGYRTRLEESAAEERGQ